MSWYQLTGLNPTNPSHYTEYIGDIALLCPDNEQICAIQATDSGTGEPVFTQALRDEMIIALHNQDPSTNVLLKVRT